MAKPDQLIKRRGKLGLVKVNIDAVDAKAWIDSMMGKEFTVGSSVFFVLESTLLLLFPLSSYSLFLFPPTHFSSLSLTFRWEVQLVSSITLWWNLSLLISRYVKRPFVDNFNLGISLSFL